MPRDLDIVSEIIRAAGAIVQKHYEAGVTADADKDGEPVTIADRDSDAFIVSALRAAFPDDEIVSEESIDDLVTEAPRGADAVASDSEGEESDAYGERSDAPPFILEYTPDAEPPSVDHAPPRVWYVDPMDGTSDFVRRTDDFVVMIGLAVAGWPVLGAVFHPPSETLYRGGHGLVAEKIVGDERTELRVSDVRDPRQARLVVSRSHTPEIIAEMAAGLGIEQMEKCGSVGLKAARIAEGAGELYLHPSIGTKLWDTCAPEAILVAAGGTFSDCDGKPLVYDPARIHNERGVFASNGRLHDAVLERVLGSW